MCFGSSGVGRHLSCSCILWAQVLHFFCNMGKARVCAVYGCTPGRHTDRRYYKFPRNDNIAKQWVHKCYRSDTINVKNAVICDIHFSKAQIRRNLKSELLDCPTPRNWRNLKDEAVPDQCLPSPQGNHQNGAHLASPLKGKTN